MTGTPCGTLGAILQPGRQRTAWCHTCKASTVIVAELLLITGCGVTPAGRLSWCEVCEDPEDPPRSPRTVAP